MIRPYVTDTSYELDEAFNEDKSLIRRCSRGYVRYRPRNLSIRNVFKSISWCGNWFGVSQLRLKKLSGLLKHIQLVLVKVRSQLKLKEKLQIVFVKSVVSTER